MSRLVAVPKLETVYTNGVKGEKWTVRYTTETETLDGCALGVFETKEEAAARAMKINMGLATPEECGTA